MKTSTWIITIIIIVGALYGLFLIAQTSPAGNGGQVTPGEALPLQDPVTSEDHSRGGVDAKAVLVEYGDFQCPACGAFFPVLKQLEEEFGDQLQVIFRHFPLRSIHPRAQLASQAAEAAEVQNKFWEMHDLLFERQNDWSSLNHGNAEETFIGYAEEIGLVVEQFEDDLNSGAVKDRIDRDVETGENANIPGTPTVFINGNRTEFRSFDDIRVAINEAIMNHDAGADEDTNSTDDTNPQ